MKILFFSRLFYPHIGGVEKHILEISKLLIKRGHKVTIVTEQYSKDLAIKEKLEGIAIYRIPQLKFGKVRKFQIWEWLWKNHNLINNSDVVHCHDVFFWYLPFRFLYFNKPVFTTFHGYEGYPLSPKSIFMHKIAEKLSRGNICIGHFIKKWYGTKPTYTAYGGVEVFDIKNQSFDKLRTKIKNQNSALFIGRLDEQTGILTYVKAVEIIRKKVTNFMFEIMGDGKFRKKIEKGFKVLGFQKNPERYFVNYRFAFVSRYLSIFEAMATKRLVFAVYDNLLKEDYLKMSPFAELINIVNSENKLSEKVLYFLKNAKKEKMIVDKAFEWVRDHTWEEMADLYLKLWKKAFER